MQRVPGRPLRLGIMGHNVRGHRPLEPETLGSASRILNRGSIAPKAVKIVSLGVEVGEKKSDSFSIYNISADLYIAHKQIYSVSMVLQFQRGGD